MSIILAIDQLNGITNLLSPLFNLLHGLQTVVLKLPYSLVERTNLTKYKYY